MTDTERVDAMADLRIVDGLGDLDIDEMTLAQVHDEDENHWKLEWRKQFRIAVDAWISSEMKP